MLVGQGLSGRIHGTLYASSKMSKMLGSGGVGSEGGMGTEGGSVTAAFVSSVTVGSSV